MHENFRFELDPDAIEESLRQLRDRVRAGLKQGRHTKVRLSYKGNPIGPDLPLAMFLAGEGVALWFTGPLGALLVNLGAKVMLDVEFIHEADELVREGLSLYMDGEVEAAEAKYREALARRPGDPSALYNLAVLMRLQNRLDDARDCLHRAAAGPEGDPYVVRAAELLAKLDAG